MTDTIVNINDSLTKYDLSDSLLTLSNQIRLFCPEHSQNLIFGMPPELVSVLVPTLIFGLGVFIQWRSKKL
jgi:hypothetical protein